MLEELLAKEESKNLEFKENTQSLQKIVQTVLAFANTAGGTILIGIKDGSKEVVGVENILVEELKVANAISNSIEPLFIPTLELITYRNKDVLIIKVPHCYGPFYLKSIGKEEGTYVRIGSTNRIADAETILEIESLREKKYFDELPNVSCSIDDIDLTQAKGIFAKHKKKFTEKTAQSLGLIVSYQGTLFPSNAGLLLFGRKPLDCGGAPIRLVRFLGRDKSEVLDHQDVDLPLIDALTPMISFIRRNTTMAAKFGAIQRQDIPEYPAEAVREALVNALLHTDYSKRGCTIQVAIFDNRIEIINPGGLLFGLDLETALSGVSRLRNKIIGRIFRELDIIEQWGSGLGRMVRLCDELNIQRPLFEDLGTFFRVTLFPRSELPSKNEEWEQPVLTHTKKNRKISAKEAQQIWKVTARTTSTRLKELVAKGHLVEVATSRFDPLKIFVLAKNQ